MRTVDLKYIRDDLQENIFNFPYDWTDITIGNITYNKQYIENAFIDYFLYYYIGYSTVDEFIWRLRRNWLDKISVLQQQLSVYPTQISLDERTIKRNYTNSSDNKYSDTPNEPMLDVDPEGKYLTDRTVLDANGDTTISESLNTVEKYNTIKSKITNVLYAWFKQFDKLFITDVMIKDYIGG